MCQCPFFFYFLYKKEPSKIESLWTYPCKINPDTCNHPQATYISGKPEHCHELNTRLMNLKLILISILNYWATLMGCPFCFITHRAKILQRKIIFAQYFSFISPFCSPFALLHRKLHSLFHFSITSALICSAVEFNLLTLNSSNVL